MAEQVTAGLRLGLIADNSAQLGSLVMALRETSHKVLSSVMVANAVLPLRADVDVWVLRILDHDDVAESVVAWLQEQDLPLLIDDATAGPRPDLALWLDRRIRACWAESGSRDKTRAPSAVWVLAASTGGPDAIAHFLRALGDRGASLAFLYAQHIDVTAIPNLSSSMQRHTSMRVCACRDGQLLSAGHVYVVSPAQQLDLENMRRFVVRDQAWNGIYQPSLNQLTARIGKRWREHSGVIIFTGMGDDGAEGARMLHASGGRVWAQNFTSCAIDSMPRCAEATGCVSFMGSPAQLGERLARYCSPDSSIPTAEMN